MDKGSVGEFVMGIATALISVLLVSGALLMSVSENRPPSAPIEPSETPGESTPAEPGVTLTPQPTLYPTSTQCIPPSGWKQYTVQQGDTVEKLAADYGLPVDMIMRANCMNVPGLSPNSYMVLPPKPTPAASATAVPPTETQPPQPTDTHIPWPTSASTTTTHGCVIIPPAGWIRYVVRQGDTLYQIGLKFNVTVNVLQGVNCLANANDIKYGTVLWVPNVITSTPRVTATRTSAPSIPTNTKVSASNTPVPPTSPAATQTFTPTPSNTGVPSNTPTATSTNTQTSTPTPTDTVYPPPAP